MRPRTRREVLAAGGAISLTAVAAACTAGDDDAAPGTSVAGATTATPATSAASTPAGTAGASTATSRPAPSPVTISDEVLETFRAEVAAAVEDFGVVGASVALVQGGEIVFNEGFGVRGIDDDEAVTVDTQFRIASNTKSMTSMLMARYVDDGRLSWDTPVIELWPEFRAPTPELTDGLKVSDLLGMATGVAEAVTFEFFVSGGGYDARRLLRSIADLTVIGPPGSEYYYNNTLVAAAPFVAMLADGTVPEALEATYAADLRRLVFDPIGMAGASVEADPRPFAADHATGCDEDLFGVQERAPFISIDGLGPAGSAIASSTDMARYVITQMQGGVNPDGTRVVSEENLVRTHQPGITVPAEGLNALPAVLLPDTVELRYCLGWFDQTFDDGRHLLWHGGGIDGFGSLMGFLPVEQVGFVVLTNVEPAISGAFTFSVESFFLRLLFGLNENVPATLAELRTSGISNRADLAARTEPVDPAAVEPYLGLYSDGFQLRVDEPDGLRLVHDIRTMRVLATAGGDYVVASGPGAVSGRTLQLAALDDGPRTMTIDGFDPVRWLTGD